MNKPKLYFALLILISTFVSCKKNSNENDSESAESFFFQSSEASYDIDIAQDNSNNFYITGSTKSRQAGTVFNISPNISLKGNGGFDAYVAKFSESGKMAWATLLGGINEDRGYVLAVGGEENVYIAGTFRDLTRIGDVSLEIKQLTNSSGGLNMGDIFLTSLDRNGKVRWVKQISGTGFETPTSIIISASGKIYVSGYFTGKIYFDDKPLGKTDQSGVFIARYGQNGALDWGKVYGNIPDAYTSNGSIYPTNTAFLPNGDLVFAGTFESQQRIGSFLLNSNGDEDIFLARLDSEGNVIWAQGYGVASTQNCSTMFIGNDGDIYIGGSFRGQFSMGANTFTSSTPFGWSCFIARLTANGAPVWASQIGSPGAQSIADMGEANGKINFVGYYSAAATIGDKQLSSISSMQGFIGEYSTSGLPVTAENLGTKDGHAKQILIDKKGQKIVVGTYGAPFTFGGQVYPSATGYDMFITKQK